jgi:hypothetical protein
MDKVGARWKTATTRLKLGVKVTGEMGWCRSRCVVRIPVDRYPSENLKGTRVREHSGKERRRGRSARATKRQAKTYAKDAMHLDFLTFEAAASVALDTRTRGAAQVLRLPTSYLLA